MPCARLPAGKDGEGKFSMLPPNVLCHIALLVPSDGHEAENEDVMRLVCKGWAAALPIGLVAPLKTWSGEATLPSGTFALEVAAPVMHPKAPPLLLVRAAFTSALQKLRLNHVAAEALPAIGALVHLHHLTIGIAWPRPPNTAPAAEQQNSSGWLDWAAGMRKLSDLHVDAVVMQLQPEEGLSSLQGLGRLRRLRLNGCTLLSDAGAAFLAALPGLSALEANPSCLSEQGVVQLLTALPQLHSLGLTASTSGAATAALHSTALQRLDLNLNLAGGSPPLGLPPPGALQGARPLHLRITNTGSLVHLSAALLHSVLCPKVLSISLMRVNLDGEAVAALAQCTQLQHLCAEFVHSVRDGAVLQWTALRALRTLHLKANWFVSEAAMASVLQAMPELRSLRLACLQGSPGTILGAALARMPRLRTLQLSFWRLQDPGSLQGVIASVGGSLRSLYVEHCGSDTVVATAVALALPAVQRLESLALLTGTTPRSEALELLANALANCQELRHIHLGADRHRSMPALPGPGPAWAGLAALPHLRSLKLATGLGWGAESFASVCAAATGLRRLVLHDTPGSGKVDEAWVSALATLPRLMHLELHHCNALSAAALQALRLLRALTQLQASGAGLALGGADAARWMHAEMPALSVCIIRG